MTTLRRMFSPADPSTWLGRLLGLLLLCFFAWVLWQLAPMIVGDLRESMPGAATWWGR